MGCAVFDFSWQRQLLMLLLLLLPFLDNQWQMPVYRRYDSQWLYLSVALVFTFLLLFLQPDLIEAIIIILLFTAIPEEWFFRSYFLQRLEAMHLAKWNANIITSVVFALMHIPAQGWLGLSVFFPSILFGWIYQRNRDLLLVILLHTIFNGIYIIYLRDVLNL